MTMDSNSNKDYNLNITDYSSDESDNGLILNNINKLNNDTKLNNNSMKNKLKQSLSLPSLSGGSNSVPNSPTVDHKYMQNLNAATLLMKNSQQILIETNPPSPSFSITRPVYNVSEFNRNYIPNETKKTTREKVSRFVPDVSHTAWIKRIKTFIPITRWLPAYNIRECLIADIVVGITIASFQVPQSMGYALIANVNPIYGLYTAFFPALMYTILGTSHHSAVGPVAIVAGLMTGTTIVEVCDDLKIDLVNNDSTQALEGYKDIKVIDIAVMISMIIGLYILIFGIFRLGFISNFLSAHFVSGFMTSAALHIFTTQIRYLTGVHLNNYTGMLALPKVYIEYFEKIRDTNLTAVVISIICVSLLLFFKLVVERLVQRMGLKLPLPIHLFIIIGGCLISWAMNLKQEYQIDIVGPIPDYFQSPSVPKFKLFKYMWSRCIPVAVVSYILTLSVGQIYGAKHNYKVDSNQEMIALGVTNIWSSFFACLASCASIPRSSVQEGGGGKTQIVSIINCICIMIVILVLSTLMSDLPKCVLASCIACALASIFAKFQEFWSYWKLSKLDASIWMITFLGVVIMNFDYGIYLGFGCSLLLLIYKSQRPKTYSLGSIDYSDIYVPISKFKRARELDGVKIYQFCGPLNFANIQYFKKELQIRSGVDVTLIKEELKAMTPRNSCFPFRDTKTSKITKELVLERKPNLPKYIIVDCSMLSYIDSAGVTTLKKIIQNHADIDILVSLSGCPVHIEATLKNEEFFSEVSSDRVYKSVHDAVTYIRDCERTIGQPIYEKNTGVRKPISKVLTSLSLDSIMSNESNIKTNVGVITKPFTPSPLTRCPDSPRSILKDSNSPRNSPLLTRSGRSQFYGQRKPGAILMFSGQLFGVINSGHFFQIIPYFWI
ncbi:prestin-like [Oppia nitens]|uniref:prestin-like n=1 Tax=Oppia nitens TaxID=1686743 RepID=UPI0023DC39DE|nr:prestin-like [Oppia nitens]